jgi:alpha-glucosidase
MQWDASPNAGFAPTGVEPWLPLADDYATRNVAQQETDPTSMLSFYRTLTALRRAEPALSVGDYTSVEAGADDVFAYVRHAPDADRFLVVLNFAAGTHTLDLSEIGVTAEVAVATDMVRAGLVDLSSLNLESNEGLVLRLHS